MTEIFNNNYQVVRVKVLCLPFRRRSKLQINRLVSKLWSTSIVCKNYFEWRFNFIFTTESLKQDFVCFFTVHPREYVLKTIPISFYRLFQQTGTPFLINLKDRTGITDWETIILSWCLQNLRLSIKYQNRKNSIPLFSLPSSHYPLTQGCYEATINNRRTFTLMYISSGYIGQASLGRPVTFGVDF